MSARDPEFQEHVKFPTIGGAVFVCVDRFDPDLVEPATTLSYPAELEEKVRASPIKLWPR
jgi:hypothetical protein